MDKIVGEKPSYWLPAILFNSSNKRNKVSMVLNQNEIETRTFFLPVHKQPVYLNIFKSKNFPVVNSFWEKGLLLPSYMRISREEIDDISSFVVNNC